MKTRENGRMKPLELAALVCGIIAALSLLGYGGYQYHVLSKKYAFSTAALEAASTTLSSVQEDNANLTEALQNEQQKNSAFSDQIQHIAQTVGFLKKVQETDPELLKKYSRVYFLNENYIPASLAAIDPNDTYDQKRAYQILTQVQPHLEKMIADAKADGVSLLVVSSYRSFGTQAALKADYRVTYGTGANTFSADQGYSEHQLGTTVDFTTQKLGASFTKFATTPEYTWLQNNAYRYGFILSYPKNNTYYQFEPWHWRFVGVDLATTLHADGKNFYDLDQRTIDGYLSILFD